MLKRNSFSNESFSYQPPFGAVNDGEGVRFSVFSRSATSMRILLYSSIHDREPTQIVQLDPRQDRMGDVWTKYIHGLTAGQLYHFQADGLYRPESGSLFDGNSRLIDPYCNALAGDFQPSSDGVIRPPKCVVVNHAFEWDRDQPLKHPMQETIIYEMHLAGPEI